MYTIIEMPTFKGAAEKFGRSRNEVISFLGLQLIRALVISYLIYSRLSKMSDSQNMSGEELGNKLLQSVLEMKAGNAGRTTKVEPNEVAKARLQAGLSQSQFASALQISARTLQEWEQGRRKPSGAAKALIQIAAKHPEIIREEYREHG